jgi:ferredoxin-nitrite reductase
MATAPEPVYCPGVFAPAVSQDGWLVRLRTPGGLLTTRQARSIAQLGQGADITVTNRANLQWRLGQLPPAAQLEQLPALGLAAAQPSLDRLRNIMASPTAGIDRHARRDTRALVTQIDRYLSTTTELAGLSAKFSIGIDGGEAVSIRQRPNDCCLVAVPGGYQLLLRTDRGWLDSHRVWPDGLGAVRAIANWYVSRSTQVPAPDSGGRRSQRPRLRHCLTALGAADCWAGLDATHPTLADDVKEPPPISTHGHLGVHPQAENDRYYLGISLPLGKVTAAQWEGLISLADRYGSGHLRLSPWQNLLLPDVYQVEAAVAAIAALGLSVDARNPAGWVVACVGNAGCTHGETDSSADAQRIMHLAAQWLDRPLQIHVSGCGKGCAYPLGSDLALWGRGGGYEIYGPSPQGGASHQIFPHLYSPWLPREAALSLIFQWLQAYSALADRLTWAEFLATL